MITDEMVTKAWGAASDMFDWGDSCSHRVIRAALEAVAPMLRAQGMREAVKIMHDTPLVDEYNDDGSMSPNWMERMMIAGDAILVRAQEIDLK